jgi:hypothetical protein
MHPTRLLLLILLCGTAAAAPAWADSTAAICLFSRHDHTVAVERGPCTFSQRQGNATVHFGERQFHFPAAEAGRSYTRRAESGSISFHREGDYTLRVLWHTVPQGTVKPPGWETDNVFLGRWLGETRAGRAVIEVLTVEPHRIRWGNAFNGICESDYSVEQLPWGRNGRYPDQLVPPSQPTDRVFGVVRLTLQPGACATGDAVIQLAMPLDGSGALEVVTYGADGRLIGQYGVFTPLREADSDQKMPSVFFLQ